MGSPQNNALGHWHRNWGQEQGLGRLSPSDLPKISKLSLDVIRRREHNNIDNNISNRCALKLELHLDSPAVARFNRRRRNSHFE